MRFPKLPPTLPRLLTIQCVCIQLMILGTSLYSETDSSIDRPNFLIIIADDQGWGDLSAHGNQSFQTPNLDSLRQQGAHFERFYVQPVCSPTRAELLTGRYALRSGILGTSKGEERMDLDEVTLADYLKTYGYRTGLFGKWHNGSQYPYHPLGRGFDTFYGFTSGHWGLYVDPVIEHNGSLTSVHGFLPDVFTSRAIEFMQESNQKKQPFLSIVSFNTPHSPMQVPDEQWKDFESLELQQSGTEGEKEDSQHTRAALALVNNLDENVGKLLSYLEQSELREQTVVIFLSDNGPNGHRWNDGMAGIKGSVSEGGVRSPCFVSWKGNIDAKKRIACPAAAIDITPTLLEFANIQNPVKKPLDGISLAPILRGEDKNLPERPLYSVWGETAAVREKGLLYLSNGALYDLNRDPNQLEDLSSKEQKETDRLKHKLDTWLQEMQSEKRDANIIPVGHPAFNITFLPARDADTHGEIKRSNRWPNDSYFTNWKSEQDALQWEIEVLSDGLYSVDIWYACAPQNVNCTLELSNGQSKLNWDVIRPHNATILGEKLTRSTLHESIVKDFRVEGMGAIDLTRGVQTLRLTSPHIPGKESIEFRMLRLTKIGTVH